MNYFLKNIPDRTQKPRESGYTMVMDKGLSIREAEDMIESSGDFIDIVKLGWATSYVTSQLDKKIKLYQNNEIPCYFGGTLFEAFVIRDQFDDFMRVVDKYNLEHVEVSDGSITMNHDEKCDFIHRISKNYTVLSEVGSKDAAKIIPPYKWIDQMQTELDAGAWKVIGEARESGNVGLFRNSGEVRQGLVEEILTQIPKDKILWEAPQKSQQVWFIKLCVTNVNLGNIATNEVIPLETVRLGLRGDTFHDHLIT